MKQLKPILLIFFLLSTLAINGQTLNRAYVNFAVGYPRHFETGITAHWFKHISTAFYIGKSTPKSGYGYRGGTGFFNWESLRNTYTNKTVLIGLTTHTLKNVDLSIMVGPSFLRADEIDNVKITEDDYTTIQHANYDVVRTNSMGYSLRSDLNFSVDQVVGINLACQLNRNTIRNDFYITAGVVFGMVKDYKQNLRFNRNAVP